jgi:hypothetical protein
MMKIDEYDLELAHRVETQMQRDDERERVSPRRSRRRRRLRSSRFATLSRLMERMAEASSGERIPVASLKEAA